MKKKKLFLDVINLILKKKLLTIFIILLSLTVYPTVHKLYYKNIKTHNFEVELYEFYNLNNNYFNYESFVYSLKVRIEDSIHSLDFDVKEFQCNNSIVFKIDCNLKYFEDSISDKYQKEINAQLTLTYNEFFKKQKEKFLSLVNRTNRDIEKSFNRKAQLQNFYEESRKEKDITSDFYYFDSNSSFDDRIFELEATLNTYNELVFQFDNKINELEIITSSHRASVQKFNLYRYFSSIFITISLYAFLILLFIS